MKIYLSLDYELYFGPQHGTVERCMLLPTRKLMEICARQDVKMTFFVDIGYLVRAEQFRKDHPSLETDYQAVCDQVRELVNAGHDCQLHIHPHWEDCVYQGDKWIMNVSRYKLADFETEEAERIVREYKQALEALTQQPVTAYRAGGWCLQPFEPLAKVFQEVGLKVDSTVFKGGYNVQSPYYYDFRNCPDQTRYYFEDDLCEPKEGGSFLELPISGQRLSPLFFWELFGWGRLNPKQHKPIGDGFPVPGGGSKKRLLTSWTSHPVCMDGYFATALNRALRSVERQNQGDDFVVIGHPKACTWYSLKKLEQFIARNKQEHTFKVISKA